MPLPLSTVRDVILDSIADGVFTVDEDYRITSFNRAAELITGVPREEAIGRPCREVFRAEICDNGCALKETRRTGRQIVNKPVYIQTATGQRLPISVSAAILQDETNLVIGGVETFRDLSDVESLRRELADKHTFADIIGHSNAMQQLFQLLPKFAESNSTILIVGDSGTGKELFAKAIHELSPRKAGPFIAVNCGALPDTLLESELFGYKAGAFTDARQDKLGRFALAEGGTIFLDEIGDISQAMQVKLLRVLQERTYEPLGGTRSVKADVRVITATNRELNQLVGAGEFRQDLFYRINVLRLGLPALRERREDVPLLVDHFVTRFNRIQAKHIHGVSEEAMAALLTYDYPGNIRELENIIEYAFVLCHGGMIELCQLPPEVRKHNGFQPSEQHSFMTLHDLEAMHIIESLRRNQGNRTAAAKELGINPSTLFRKIKAMKINLPEGNGRTRNPSSG